MKLHAVKKKSDSVRFSDKLILAYLRLLGVCNDNIIISTCRTL